MVPDVECPLAPVHESQQKVIDVSSASEIEVQNSPSDDLPIALRKGTRAKSGVPPPRYGFEHDITMSRMHPYLLHIEHSLLHYNMHKYLETRKKQNKILNGVRPCWKS